jgi:AcrR family transcriptional regulator
MDTRAILLSSALRVFTRHGYRRASMSQIADDAGLTRQAVYHHFASKELLFEGLVDLLHAQAHAAALAAAEASAGLPVADRLSRVLLQHHRWLVDSVAASAHADELMAEGARRCGELVVAHGDRFQRLLVSIVRAAIAAGEAELARGVSERQFVTLLQAATKGVKVTYLQEGAKAHAQALDQMVHALCRGSLAPVLQFTKSQKTGTMARRARS